MPAVPSNVHLAVLQVADVPDEDRFLLLLLRLVWHTHEAGRVHVPQVVLHMKTAEVSAYVRLCALL